MSVYGMFSPGVLGMLAQSHSMNTIATNITNVNTGGYKGSETRFTTVLGNTFDNLTGNSGSRNGDIGGVAVQDKQMISKQGTIIASQNEFDLAIAGSGFFILNSQVDGSGNTFYGRDGSFQMINNGTSTATDPFDSSSTITVSRGFLADKNGYFVQGYPIAADGTVNTSGGLQSLRIDQFAFANTGAETTTADLELNLDAVADVNETYVYAIDVIDSSFAQQTADLTFTKTGTNAWNVTATTSQDAVAQVDTVTLAGTVEANDVFSVTVNGTTFTYTMLGTETDLGDAASNLISQINADPTVSASVTATAGATAGQIVITADTAGDAFTSSASATQGNTAVAQVDTLTLGGTIEAGDVYSATINGTTISYTVTGAEANINVVAANLASAINANATVNTAVTANATGAGGQMTITADTAGTPFTATVSAVSDTADAQVDTITIGGANSAFGDSFTVTIDGNPVTFFDITGGLTPSQVRDQLVSAINADVTVNGIVTAAPSGTAGLTITADTAGTAFVRAQSTTSGGTTIAGVNTTPNDTATLDNTLTRAATTANVTVFNDNGPTASVTTTANVEDTQTTTATALTFDATGQIQTPTSIAFSLGFAGGSTADFSLDISNLTQFAGAFFPVRYDRDGFESANMRSFSFDRDGQVVGLFDDGTQRELYKLPLGVFQNPDGLQERNGNVYIESVSSGDVRIAQAGDDGFFTFNPFAREISNVDLAGEMSKMIITQNAYNSAATLFKTVDEMTETARDLKA